MDRVQSDRWERARTEVMHRWERIIERIQARDEGGVMALANVMDEFCEEAITDRHGEQGSRCLFCKGFTESGGCHGMLIELNRAVLAGRWADAKTLAEGYLARLGGLSFGDPSETALH